MRPPHAARRMRLALAFATLAALPLAACQSTPVSEMRAPRTAAELSDHRRTSTHAEVLAFLDAVERAGDRRVHRTTFGTTVEGRDLPLVIVADPPVRTPAEAHALGKPVVLVMANIHGGEVEGKEVCQMILREVVWAGAEDPIAPQEPPYPVDDVVLMLAPIYNADGNDALGAKNRPLQHGPARSGRRPNAQGLDLNRDYMKLESPEARALVRLFTEWDPHVIVDLHTTNGSAHGYPLTYAPPLTPSADPALLEDLQDDWLPTIRARMHERWGFRTFDYGNFLGPEGDHDFVDEPDRIEGWRTFDHRPRYGNNYAGLRNRYGILSEAYAYEDFATRIAATHAFVVEILRYAAAEGGALPRRIANLDRRTTVLARNGELEQHVEAEPVERAGSETVLVRGFRMQPDPDTGETVKVAHGPATPVEVPVYVEFAATESRTVPKRYLLMPEMGAVAEHLRRHGIEVIKLRDPVTAAVEVYRLRETSVAEQPFQGHRLREGEWAVAVEERTVPAGGFMVAAGQPLGRLVFQLLDPFADDGLFAWNFYDPWISGGAGAELPLYGWR